MYIASKHLTATINIQLICHFVRETSKLELKFNPAGFAVFWTNPQKIKCTYFHRIIIDYYRYLRIDLIAPREF